MTIGPKGYEATQQRVSAILARVRSMRPEPPALRPGPTPSPIAGLIGRGNLGGSLNAENGFAPFDPMGGAASLGRSEDKFKGLLEGAAQQAGVDPLLLRSLVQAESDFDPNEVSTAGAIGLTQLMPQTAKQLGVTDPYDPGQNLLGGARYLASMLKEFGGDERLALAAYNAGPGAVKRHGGIPPYRETQNYVRKVMAQVEALRARR